jgi:hypothetical protein
MEKFFFRREVLRGLIRGSMIIGVIILAIVNFNLNENSMRKVNVSNLYLKILEAYTFGEGGESSSTDDSFNCWKEKLNETAEGLHFTKCVYKSSLGKNICEMQENAKPKESTKDICFMPEQ